eukprot:gnl/TRDRNA2_/TRDRNA2_178337_c0_seq1.p1 gnl/TRDRNA2_/TRDRNA2_178337_c0~~gnl/TRDRNA2_/TRDRNA2_178337_c0_seq1.p1  ORF type:complete len:136 (+),score=18.43 gnl/TRDRNA2_/TRDRNA2_178337_c0_seq1:77-484(+)
MPLRSPRLLVLTAVLFARVAHSAVLERKPPQLTLLQRGLCPEPKPCACTCYCDPIMYGTPPPALPTPFATAAPPVLSMLEETGKQSFGLASDATDDPPPIILGPTPPPLLPLPPGPDRSFCPKAAACNCFCPCRE